MTTRPISVLDVNVFIAALKKDRNTVMKALIFCVQYQATSS